jgi:hypothetical protein
MNLDNFMKKFRHHLPSEELQKMLTSFGPQTYNLFAGFSCWQLAVFLDLAIFMNSTNALKECNIRRLIFLIVYTYFHYG